MLEVNAEERLQLKKSGQTFLGILNDIKRRPEDAASELGVTTNEIYSIINGEKPISQDLVDKATRIWPVNSRDFFNIRDDCPLGVKIMTAEESKQSSRIMDRAGKPYYEYRDTAMSTTASFRPEWIEELCIVENNDATSTIVQWNNGHFLHQFTYFVGNVNFYYEENGIKKIAVMKTGDSMYITPFTRHTFATRSGSDANGLILALTYGNKITGDTQQEVSCLPISQGSNLALDFSTTNNSSASLIKFYREISNLTVEEMSKRTGFSKTLIDTFENGEKIPGIAETKKIACSLGINTRDLLPNDKIENKVIIKKHENTNFWYYPENKKSYKFSELASTTTLPDSKAFEVEVFDSNDENLDLKVGLHQYVYNIGNTQISINWEHDGTKHSKIFKSDDSCYVKPFTPHNFRGTGKLLILRIGGNLTGDSKRELSFIGKDNVKRAISETMQWFDSHDEH